MADRLLVLLALAMVLAAPIGLAWSAGEPRPGECYFCRSAAR